MSAFYFLNLKKRNYIMESDECGLQESISKAAKGEASTLVSY